MTHPPPVSKSFLIDFPGGFCQATTISYITFSHHLPVHHLHDSLPAKLVLVSMKKLQVIAKRVTAETLVGEPHRIWRNYTFPKDGAGSNDHELDKVGDEIVERLAEMVGILPETVRRRIRGELCECMVDAINKARSRSRRAVWMSLTVEMVEKVEYDERVGAHRAIVEEALQHRRPLNQKMCAACGTRCTAHDEYMRMPCGDYCHIACIWNWPRPIP